MSQAAPISGDVLNPGMEGKAHWLFGVGGGPVFSWFLPGPYPFQFPDPYKFLTHPLFDRVLQSGKGLGYTAGFTVDLRTADGLNFFGNVSYVSHSAVFSPQNSDMLWDTVSSAFVMSTVQDRLALTIASGDVEFGMRYFFIPNAWYVFGGLGVSVSILLEKSYSLEENITTPSNAVYVGDSTNIIMGKAIVSQGVIANTMINQIDGIFGAGGMIPVEPGVYFAPEIFVMIPATKILQGVDLYVISVGATCSVKVEF